MSLTTAGRYDPNASTRVGDRAVVVGGSMAGLLAARVLADAYDHVTVVDRDRLPTAPAARKGVPQGRHPHALLEAGRATLEDLFPGFGAELVRAGGLVVEVGTEARLFDQGGFLAEGSGDRTLHCASRPLIEAVVRRRLADRDGVRLRSGCQLADYLLTDGAATVRGVVVHSGETGREELGADLVVDATGRGSRTPGWLTEHGFPAPDTDEVRIDVGYATTVLERPDDDHRCYLLPPAPPQRCGGGLLPIESGRWLLTLAGVHGDHPPRGSDDLTEFAGGLPSPVLAAALEEHPRIEQPPDRYRFPANIRRRYEDLDRFPQGLIVIGDAVASFNPVYGQGMSVAALEAVALHRVLAAGGDEDLARRFFARAGRIVDGAWNMAVGADFRFPQTEGPKPRATGLVNRYLARLVERAHTDDRLADAFYAAMFLVEPATSLFRPPILWRTLRPGWLRQPPPASRPSIASRA